MTRIIIQSQANENIKDLVSLALENQLRIISTGISKTKRKLQKFESENKMLTKVFFEKYEKGELGDDMMYIRWAGEYETLKRLENDYQALRETELCS